VIVLVFGQETFAKRSAVHNYPVVSNNIDNKLWMPGEKLGKHGENQIGPPIVGARPALQRCQKRLGAPEIRADSGPVTAIRLFSIVEEAWAASDTDRLTSLVDTTVVRIAVKPGTPLTSALVLTSVLLLARARRSGTMAVHG